MLNSSRDTKKMKTCTLVGAGKERPLRDPRNLSYYWDGEGEQGEDDKWDRGGKNMIRWRMEQ